jgi:nucleoside 2-deoxyribosyltransferase
MPFPATVLSVLIASPSDVPEERQAIANCLHAWNALNSRETGMVLLPVMWESHSAPVMGDRPQEIINEQLVRSCDMLIGAFWTRLGSPTGEEDSGTVEEIKWFLRNKKPVMLYFSQAAILPDRIEIDQWKRLQDFKTELLPRGLVEQYSAVSELSTKLSRQLTVIIRGLSLNTTVDAKTVRLASSETNSKSGRTKVNASRDEPVAQVDDVPPYLETYSDKSFIVVGDTREWKDELGALGGSWIKTRFGERAWCFSNRKLKAVATKLKIPSDVRESRD